MFTMVPGQGGQFQSVCFSEQVGILPNMGIGELASLDLEARGNCCYGAWTVPDFLPCDLGSTPVTLE